MSPHITPDELDSLALEKGDAAAETKVIEVTTPLVISMVKQMLRSSSLRPHAQDLQAEGLLGALKAIRRYDGRGHLMPYLAGCVLMELRRAARGYYSSIGAHIAAEDDLNFQDSIFKDTVWFEETVSGQMPDHVRRMMENRNRLFNYLKHSGLSPFEREVILRRWGIYWRRASTNPRYGIAARTMRSHSCDEIGLDYGLTGERIRQIQRGIMAKLGITTKPAKAPRTRRLEIPVSSHRSKQMSTSRLY